MDPFAGLLLILLVGAALSLIGYLFSLFVATAVDALLPKGEKPPNNE